MNHMQNDSFRTIDESPTQDAINRVQSEFAKTGVFATSDLSKILGNPRESVVVFAAETYASGKVSV